MRQQTLGQYLRALRVQQGVTQAQLARKAQVSMRAIGYWEKDEFKPGSHEAQAVLTALGVSTQEQAHVLLNLMPLRGENVVRHDSILQSSTLEMPLPGAGDLLAALRVRRGLSSQQAAELLKTTATTLSRWENNRFSIPETMLPLIQTALNASATEMQGLRQRMIMPAEPTEPAEPFSVERCNQWVDTFGARLYLPGQHSIDLDALALQRKLWPLATRHPEARQALALVTLYYGVWLSAQNRVMEVPRQAQRAFNIYAEDMSRDNDVAQALNLLSWCKVFRSDPKPEQGERFLRRWISRMPRPMSQLTLLCDLALYASQSGKSELALRYLQDARKVNELPGIATEKAYWYLQVTRARVLSHTGRPYEAYDALTRILPASETGRETMALANSLMFTEIMVAAKEFNLAETWLRSIYARMEPLELPRLRAKADAIARLL